MFLVELLFEILFEFLVPLVFELLLSPQFRAKGTIAFPIMLALMVALGAGLGWVSILIRPVPFLDAPNARVASLVASPLAVAATMWAYGTLRTKRQKPTGPMDKFWSALFLAASFNAVRFIFTL